MGTLGIIKKITDIDSDNKIYINPSLSETQNELMSTFHIERRF